MGLGGAGVVIVVGTLFMEDGAPEMVWLRGVVHRGLGPVLGMGYAAMVVGAAVRYRFGLGWLEFAGQMALTNFVAQSVVMTGVFYGLGLEGSWGRRRVY